MLKNMKIEKTKKNLPAMWERGGGYTNTGEATIIAGPNGEKKRPVYIRRRGSLACDNHALFVVKPGDVVVKVSHHRRDFEIEIYKILDFEEETAVVEQVNSFSRGEWDKEPPTYLEQAVQAAMNKATCYHCRSPHFVKEESQ